MVLRSGERRNINSIFRGIIAAALAVVYFFRSIPLYETLLLISMSLIAASLLLYLLIPRVRKSVEREVASKNGESKIQAITNLPSSTNVISIGNKQLEESTLYPLYDLSARKILSTAKHSVSFSGSNLDGLVDLFAPEIKERCTNLKLKFLLIDPLSEMAHVLSTQADSVKKNVAGQTQNAIQNLREIRKEKLLESDYDRFEIRVHKGLPFNMTLVDVEDTANSFIVIGFYCYHSATENRPCAIISSQSESYATLRREFEQVWKTGKEYKDLSSHVNERR